MKITRILRNIYMNTKRHYRRFLFLLAMLSAATFGTAQISFDPGDGCLNVIDVSYAQGIGEYGDEHRVNGKWETLSIKPRKDGAVYAFPSIGYELAAHASRHFTIHIRPDMYDFEQGRAYRIGKEYTVSGEKRSGIAYCNFTTD